MWKAIVAAIAVLTLAGTSVVRADHRGGFDGARRSQPSMEDLRAFSEARLAALKAGLVLSAEQEKNWPAFERAARDLGTLRLDRITAMRNAPAVHEPAERLRQRATAMSETAAALQKLAEATDPLYKSLDEGQKRRFMVLSRLAGPRMEHFRGRDGHGPRHHHWGPRRTDHGPRSDGAHWRTAPVAIRYLVLAPAVALPAPRHDRRRTGAAGSPPGGFPFGALARGLAGQVPGPLLQHRPQPATDLRCGAHSSVGRAADS